LCAIAPLSTYKHLNNDSGNNEMSMLANVLKT
jgi:hypothetical protein